MVLDLKVRTLDGDCWLRSLHPLLRVEELKKLLYETVHVAHIKVPKPENQNLVYDGSSLDENISLRDMGIKSGDSLVLIHIPKSPDKEAADSSEMPDAESIAKAITEYAKRNGLEDKLNVKDEPHSRRPRRTSSSFGYDQLRTIIDALEGRIGRQGGFNIEQSAAPSQQLVLPTSGDNEEVSAPPPQIPEPSAASVESLSGMGFSEELIRKALLLHRNNLENALDWLLEHRDDPDVATPLTQEQLAQIYGHAPRRRRRREADPELVTRLQEMGFSEQHATSALRAFGNNIEIAVSWLVRHDGQHAAPPLPYGEGGAAVDRAGSAEAQVVEPREQQETGDGDGDVNMEDTDREDDIMDEGDEPSLPQPPPLPGVDQDSQLSALNPLDQPVLNQSMAMDTDSEMQSPSSPDVGIGQSAEAIGDVQAHVHVGGNLEEALDEESFEEADDVIGVDFQEGELGGLDLEDVERLLGDGSEGTQRFVPRLQQRAGMDGLAPEQLTGVADSFQVLVNHPGALEEAMHNPNLVDRLREVLNMLGVQEESGELPIHRDEAGPSGEGPAEAQ